ncbi:MAG: hypothetical protein GXY50_02445 [Syntrophomonadaceae bacterium]|nr:hypothetical protein [Syntrophomonadaceae bacterium]
MNIFHELKAFSDWSIINRPTTGEIALWHALLGINNRAGWKEWFTTANQSLQLLTGLSKSSLDRTRNKLCQRGLLEYRPGTTRQAGSYRLVSLWVQSRDECGSNVRLIRDQSGSNSGNINKHIYNLNGTREHPSAERSSFEKIKYAEYVSMTETEHQNLLGLFGEEGTKEWINRLNLWKGSKGKKTNSDYFTILNWERMEKENQKQQREAKSEGTEEREIYMPPKAT